MLPVQLQHLVFVSPVLVQFLIKGEQYRCRKNPLCKTTPKLQSGAIFSQIFAITDMKSESLLEVSAFPFHPLSQRIAGGVPAPEAGFPFQVHISDTDGNSICGGTILNAVFVLTAAHCLFGRNSHHLRVIAGDHDRARVEWPREQTRAIEAVILHENYKPGPLQEGNGVNDLALVKVSLPFTFNNYVSAIPFIRRPSQWKGSVTVSGWGSTHESGPSSVVLQKVEVPIVPRPQCQGRYGHLFNITDYHVCAGSPGRDSCKGDSGGPLSGYLLPNYERILVGITTAGLLCHDLYSGAPGVYTNLSKHAGWIENRMAVHSAKTKTTTTTSSCSTRNYFFCPMERRCIPSTWVNNGKPDCMNGEDERISKPSTAKPKAAIVTRPHPSTTKTRTTLRLKSTPRPTKSKDRESPLTKLVEYFKTLAAAATTRKPQMANTTGKRTTVKPKNSMNTPKNSMNTPNPSQTLRTGKTIVSGCVQPGEFKCPSEPKCISSLLLNNGVPDCVNGEDEFEAGGGCRVYQFLCRDGLGPCVPSWWCPGSQPAIAGK